MKTVFLFLVLFTSITYAQQEIKIKNDLEINNCTGFVNGTWGHCCYEHDILYWIGGTYQDRKNADTRLKQCVNVSRGPGDIMYEGVRRFGFEFWSAAWGHVSFSALTQEERDLVNAEVALWKNLGQPPTFQFINYETALFPVVTPQHHVLVTQRIKQLIKTPEYAQFFKTYVKATGQYPFTVQYH